MDALDVARWQFGVTTVYHFLFVPLTIGLSVLVAILQTAWHRTGDEKYLKLTKFYGKLFLINFAMGVVTGIVQEFQFGMNWSDYSRFVGDIFGAPLAIEALVAFFLESTFIGLWIFGWDRLPTRLHLASIWAAAIGTNLSAYFILAANSFMQNPVGYRINPDTGRAELTDFVAVLTNKVALITFPHTLAGAFLVAGSLVTTVGLWHLMRHRTSRRHRRLPVRHPLRRLGRPDRRRPRSLLTGDIQGKIMTQVQPMKMAAAEGLYTTESPASFSVLTIGSLDGSREVFALKIPYLLSYLGTGDPHGTVHGINDLQAQYASQYGPGSYTPIIPVTYWSFRFMIGFGLRRRRHRPARPLDPTQRPHPHQPLAATRRPDHARCCRCSPTPSAGSSPRWAANPGSSSAKCSPATASPAASPSPKSSPPSPPSPSSTPPSPSSRSNSCSATPAPATRRHAATPDDTDDAERPLAFAY